MVSQGFRSGVGRITVGVIRRVIRPAIPPVTSPVVPTVIPLVIRETTRPAIPCPATGALSPVVARVTRSVPTQLPSASFPDPATGWQSMTEFQTPRIIQVRMTRLSFPNHLFDHPRSPVAAGSVFPVPAFPVRLDTRPVLDILMEGTMISHHSSGCWKCLGE